jgi:hypothetical protein
MKLEKLIPLPEAARRLGLSVEALTALIENGTIRANIHEGEILVPESQVKQAITRKQFDKLKGTPITVAQAVEKYGISDVTISKWARLGYIAIIQPGYGMTIDAADMAYCAAIYKAKGGKRGTPIFDESGNPYELKRPEVAAYRHKRKVQLEKQQRIRA